MHLVLQFLGLPQVHLDDKPIATDRRKAIALLAYLAVNDIGRPHQKYFRESLSALFWPDYEQAKAFSNLRRTIWEIHQAIGEGWLMADRESVHLNPDAEVDLDVARFQELLSQSRQQNDPTLRIPLLIDAVKLYRDHFLTGFSLKDAPNFNEWAFAESENLRRKFADALTMLSEDHCALGQADQAIPYARRLVTLDQLNESAHRQLMQVYIQAGQHSAALKQYQTCEQILRKELNLDPQPETRTLYKKILKGEVKPIHVEKQTVIPKNNLPLPLSSFIGREKDQNEIIDLVKKTRLVSLVGTGGIGKSRLSIQTAFTLLNNFPNGTWLVELAPLSDPAPVPQAIVNTLGLLEQAGRSHLNILTDFLQNKRALLILDNCEHLIEACAQLAETLLRACPDLHILATSREALSIAGEAVYLVPSLTTPDPLKSTLDTLSQYEAVQLFLERGQSAMRDFSLNQENAYAIAQVCHHLDGIPLALELAAARVRGLSVEQIASRLDDRFHLLTGGTRTVLPRHQTLQALIDWSHDLLAESERVLLRRLSVFAGGWTLEAAESTCASDDLESNQILDTLLRLVDKSLVVAKTQGTESRYHMLETIRQYAREKLRAAGEGELMHQQHLTYFVDLAERAEPNLRAFDMVMWLDRLETELDNIRVALENALEGDVEAELRLASALMWFWHIRGHRNEAIDWLEKGLSIEAIERAEQHITPNRAMIRGKALNVSGLFMTMFFNVEKAPERLEESLALFQKLGNEGKRGRAYALFGLAVSTPDHNVPIRIRSLLEQSLALFREIGDKFGTAECLMSLAGYLSAIDGDHKQASILLEELLALRREIGDEDGIASALGILSDLAFEQGDYERAIGLREESLDIFQRLKNKWAIGYGLSVFAEVFMWQGNYKGATKIYQEALAFAQDISDAFLSAYSSYSLAGLMWLQGNYAAVTNTIMDCLSVFREVGNHWMVVGAQHTLGDISLAEGDLNTALRWYEAAMKLSREMQITEGIILSLNGIGKVAWSAGDQKLAEERFNEALKMSSEKNLKLAVFHALYGLGRVAQSRGAYTEARAFYGEALKTHGQRTNHPFPGRSMKTYSSVITYPLGALAALAIPNNQMERAVKLLSALEHTYKLIQFQLTPIERAEHDQAIATARAALGEEEFAKAWAKGQGMTLEEAVAYALKED